MTSPTKSTYSTERWALKLAKDRARYKAKRDAPGLANRERLAKYAKRKRVEYAKRKAANRCTRCNAGKPEPGRVRCRYCQDDVLFHNINYQARLRAKGEQ